MDEDQLSAARSCINAILITVGAACTAIVVWLVVVYVFSWGV